MSVRYVARAMALYLSALRYARESLGAGIRCHRGAIPRTRVSVRLMRPARSTGATVAARQTSLAGLASLSRFHRVLLRRSSAVCDCRIAILPRVARVYGLANAVCDIT